MPPLTPDHRVHRSTEAMAAELDGQAVLLHTQTGAYYYLDPVGTEVWARIEHSVAIRDLCAGLATEYDVAPATCLADVLAFLESLRGLGLIEVE